MSDTELDQSYKCPDSAINVTSDAEVKKVVLKEGHGDIPQLHSRCLVNFVGRLLESQTVFMNSKDESTSGSEPIKLTAGRDSVTREAGLHLAVATMKTGEVARIWVSPRYGYGAAGSFSFPTVPPNAHLVYDLELLSAEPPVDNDGRDQRDLTYEERLERADRRRADGNTAFKEGKYELALERYTASLSYVDEDLLIQLEGFHYDRAMATRLPALLNMAACHLKLHDYDATIRLCSQVLADDRNNAKAYYRRGSARLALGQTEMAILDLQTARKLAPDDAGIAKDLATAKSVLREEHNAGKALFKGVIEKTGGNLYEEEERPLVEGKRSAVVKDNSSLKPRSTVLQNVYTALFVALLGCLVYFLISFVQ